MEKPLIKPFKKPNPEDINTREDEPDKHTLEVKRRHWLKDVELAKSHINDFDALEEV